MKQTSAIFSGTMKEPVSSLWQSSVSPHEHQIVGRWYESSGADPTGEENAQLSKATKSPTAAMTGSTAPLAVLTR